jgi:hypothetical protein
VGAQTKAASAVSVKSAANGVVCVPCLMQFGPQKGWQDRVARPI